MGRDSVLRLSLISAPPALQNKNAIAAQKQYPLTGANARASLQQAYLNRKEKM